MASTNSNYVLFGVDFGSNQGQRELIRQINEDCQRKPVVYCRGAAGTGKTFAALAASLSLVRGKGAKKKYKNIYYVREPVEIGHRLGYLKGTEEDKYAPYLGPLLDNYNHLMAKGRKAGAIPDNIRQPKKIKAKMDDEEMDAQPVEGKNIRETKREIEKTMDTINEAFENLLDSFYRERAWDISTDISVLQTMLANEGLTKDDMARSMGETGEK